LATELVELGIVDRIFDLFFTANSPEIVGHCATIIAEMSYWITLPVSEECGVRLVERCSECFDLEIESLNESLFHIAGHFCADYPPLGNHVLARGFLTDCFKALIITVNEIEAVVRNISWLAWIVAKTPFEAEYLPEIVEFVVLLLKYRFIDSRVYGLKILQELLRREPPIDLPPSILKRFLQFSADEPRVVREMMLTVKEIKNDEVFESLLTDDFLNNLSLQLYYHMDEVGAEVLKFMRFILPITRPIIDDLIIVFTYRALGSGTYRVIHQALKFLNALCDGHPTFALDLAAAGVCALVMPVLTNHSDETPAVRAFALLLAVASACELEGIDIASVPGRDDAAIALGQIPLEALPDDETRVQVSRLREYFGDA
jgi:hypothetical protein